MKWTSISCINQAVMNPEFVKEYRGWLNYRLEYREPNGCGYSDMECTLWVPYGFDIRKFEKDINESIDNTITIVKDAIQKEIMQWEAPRVARWIGQEEYEARREAKLKELAEELDYWQNRKWESIEEDDDEN